MPLPGERAAAVPPEEPDQVVFAKRLERLNERLVKGLPDYSDQLQHTAVGYREVVPEYQALAERLDSAHLSDAVLKPFAERGEKPHTISFEPQPMWALGRENSHRNTFFGTLKLASASSETTEDVPVAVKQFLLGEAGNAIQECATMQYLAQQGVDTLEPVGIIMHRWNLPSLPMVYLLTRMRPELATLDSPERWVGVTAGDVAERLQPVVKTLVKLHEKGVTHGDPKLRNIGMGESEDSEIAHDLEFSTSFRDLVEGIGAEDAIPEALPELLDQEFHNIRVSLRKIVFPSMPASQRPATPEEEFIFELNAILEPYHMAISASDSPYREVLGRAYNIWLNVHRQSLAEQT